MTSPTSSTCHIPGTLFELQCRLLFEVFELEQISNKNLAILRIKKKFELQLRTKATSN